MNGHRLRFTLAPAALGKPPFVIWRDLLAAMGMSFHRRRSKTRRLLAHWRPHLMEVSADGRTETAVPLWMAAAALGAEASEGRIAPGLDIEFKRAADAAVSHAGEIILGALPAQGNA